MPNYDERYFTEQDAENRMNDRGYRPGKRLVNRGGYVMWDTNDPYILIREAKEAKELLDKGYIKGALADLGTRADGITESPNHGWSNDSNTHPLDIRATGFCAMGAVMAVQGHETEVCGLIRRLDIAAYHHRGYGVLAPKATSLDQPIEIRAYNVNDQESKSATMAVFDMAIDQLQAEIDLAEAWAADEYAGQKPEFTSMMDWLYGPPVKNDNPWVQRVLERFYAKESE